MMYRRTTAISFAILLLLVLSSCATTVLELDVGTCFDDPSDLDNVTDVPIVDCAEPHDNEVIALATVSGSEYPGDDRVNEIAGGLCVDAFDEYVGISYAQSYYEVGWLAPTDESWSVGDREVICMGFDPAFAKITGSIQGIAE